MFNLCPSLSKRTMEFFCNLTPSVSILSVMVRFLATHPIWSWVTSTWYVMVSPTRYSSLSASFCTFKTGLLIQILSLSCTVSALSADAFAVLMISQPFTASVATQWKVTTTGWFHWFRLSFSVHGRLSMERLQLFVSLVIW